MNNIRGKSVVHGVIGKLCAVKPADTVSCANPEVVKRILIQRGDVVRRKSFIACVMVERQHLGKKICV